MTSSPTHFDFTDLLRKVSETFLARISIIAIGLISSVLVARILGPDGRGLFAAALTTVSIATQFANLGLHSSNTFFASKNPSLVPQLISNSLYICFVFGIGISLLTYVFFHLFPGLAPIHGSLLIIALIWIPFGLAYLLFQNLLLGVQQVRAFNKIEIGSKILNVALILLLVVFHSISVENVFGVSLIVIILSFLWSLTKLKQKLPSVPRFSTGLFKENFLYGAKAYLAALFAFLVIKIDILMIQHFLGEAATGYYSIAANLSDLVYIFPMVVGTILFPKLVGISDIKEKWIFTKKVTKLTALVFLLVVGISGAVGKPLIILLYGKEFEPAFIPFLALLPGIFCLGIQTVIVQFLNSIGFPKKIVGIWIMGTLLNIGLNYFYIPKWGNVAAALVSSASYFLIFILIALLVKKTVKQIA